jgi:lysozyme
MKHSQDITRLVRQYDGCCYLCARHDSLAECYVIGFGHTDGVVRGMAITLNQAYKFLNQDLAVVEAAINRAVETQLTQKEYDALIDFAFYYGWVRVYNSPILTLINSGNFHSAADELERWDFTRGAILAQLLRQRLPASRLVQYA